jgi:uncharacterized membrane protein
MTVFEHTVPAGFLFLALLLALLAGGFSAWRFLPKNLGNTVLSALYVASLFVLAWCILLPGRKDAITNLLKPRFVIAVDTSNSMTLGPPDQETTRWATVEQILKQPWTKSLAADCEIEVFPFSTNAGESLSLAQARKLTPGGEATLIRDSLKQITDRYAGVNVTGALLLSDGIDTREAFDDWAGAERPFPIHTVRLEPPGEWLKEPDLRIDSMATSRRVTAGWKTELKVKVSGQGTRGAPVNIQIFENDKLVADKPTQIPDDGGEREMVFELEHPEVGVFDYRAHVPPLPGEANTDDNEYIVSVQVVDASNRLLYVEGIPRWDYKFLRRILLAQNQISPVIFYTGPDGQPQGGAEAPGMTADMTAAELTLFNIVILGNIDAEELGQQRAANLVQFVEEGGSLVLLGGAKAWAPNGFFQTALGEILPVRSTGMNAVQAAKPFPVRLTDTARAHPAFAGDTELWETIPPVLSVFSGSTLSPAAQVLVNVDAPEGALPVVATQRYGQGKVTVILTDSLWRWQLGPEASKTAPYQRFWTQLISWLLPQEEDVEEDQLDLFTDRDQLYLGDELDLHARIGGQDASPADGIECVITMPDGREIPYRMKPSQVVTPSGKTFAGFALPFKAEAPGLHKAVATAMINGVTKKSDPLTLYVRPFSPETMPRPINADVLQTIAKASEGAWHETIQDLNKALSALEPAAIEEETAEFQTLWRNWPTIIALMTLLGLTWALRKLRNMP